MKLIIAGSRTFTDYALLCSTMSTIEQPSEVVCGMAQGADSLGERWAICQGIPVKRFPAQWDTYGKRAGYLRNTEMAQYATHLLAFWDGKSKGTGHMVDLAKKHALKIKLLKI